MEIIGLLWSEIIVRPMTNSLVLTYAVFFNNFGLAIIIFTVILRVATFPLTIRQTRVMKRMSQLQPRLKEVQQRYAGDRAKISQETMKLYREQGINPLGCLGPMALQFPIFIGMFYAIRDTLPTFPHALAGLGPKLYSQLPMVDAAVPVNSSFLWLDLGHPDPSPLLMPILVGLSTWLSMRTTTLPSADPRQASTNRLMQWMMPAMLGFITISFPSGLALYWIVSNLVGMIIQYSVTGRAGLFPSRGMAPASTQPVKEIVRDGDQRQHGDDRQNSGGSRRVGFKGARRKSRGGRGKRY